MRRPFTRISLALTAAVWLARICVADAGDDPLRPVEARVITAGAAIHSGPGDEFYLTDTLPEETVVEVYRRQPDGWCAIRPPGGSFSWVYAQHVQPAGDGLAQINKDDAPARVGSRLSARRNVIQVHLRQGEVVEILGDDQREGETWYKIAPPAGEFRWVQAKHLAPLGSDGTAWEQPATIATVSLEQPASSQAEEDSQELTAPPLVAESSTTWTAASDSKPTATSLSSSEDITPVGSSAAGASQIPTAEFAGELADLELRLSRMVAEPMETWSVDSLEQAAERLLSQADTVPDRDAIKVTLAKIDRFAAIQRRHRLVHADAGGPAAEAEAAGNVPASPFDAVGTLRPVVSRRPGAPQFALVNDQGQVISFLTPTPDMNLQPYLGRRIGVVGSRGYIPEFRRAHVTASRVTPLTDRLLR